MAAGDRLYFLLKAPLRRVGGYGCFVRYEELTANQAWNAFGRGNGADSATELVEKVSTLALKNSKSFVRTDDPNIGCIVLRDLIIVDQDRWLRPEDAGHSFPSQVVKLKYFSEPDHLGPLLGLGFPETLPFNLLHGKAGRRSSSQKDRKGQSAFRDAILENYGHRCAAVGTRVSELLEAAHIQPYIDERSNHPQNGICFRVDLHRLFDAGLMTVSADGKIVVSSLLSTTNYSKLHGKPLRVPSALADRPSNAALEFHRTSVFR